MGGRNQELALAAVADLAGLDDLLLVTLATDGGDGPTDAAISAVATGATLDQAKQLGQNPAAYLARNELHRFFAALGDTAARPNPDQRQRPCVCLRAVTVKLRLLFMFYPQGKT